MVPGGFTQLELPTYLDQLRARLFGRDPDRAFLNYRVRQYLEILHSTPMVAYVLDLDPRVTYGDFAAEDFYDPALFAPRATQLTGNDATTLSFLGTASSPDGQGRMRHQYAIEILTSDTIEVKQLTKPARIDIQELILTESLSNRLSLLDSGYEFRINSNALNEAWRVEVLNRPTRGLADIVAGLATVGAAVLTDLFGAARVEPFRTFENLWRQHRELPWRLSGLLLALVYRTEEVRLGR